MKTMKRSLLSLFCFIVYSCCFAQSYISLGAGSGVDYGGIGGKVSINPSTRFGLVGGLGKYIGPPLSFGKIDDDRLTKQNLSGLGYSVGWEFFCCALHYINTGKYNGEKSLQGINLRVFGGDSYFNSESIFRSMFINYALNITVLYDNEVRGAMIGVSLGLGKSFLLSR